MKFYQLLLLALTCSVMPLQLSLGQTPESAIEISPISNNDANIITKAGVLREAGKLLKLEDVQAQMKTPVPGAVQKAPVARQPLRGREIAEKARKGFLRIGFYYLCKRCDHWHLNLAGGYAIAKDAAVTCHHVIEGRDDMREGYLIAVDEKNEVIPVLSVLAANKKMDTAVLRIGSGSFVPIGLNDAVAVGDPAYCFSFPLGQRGYFSNGIVNRFYWKDGRGSAGTSLADVISLRVNVSTDWAPGSSGAAIVDECGNAIGHVDTISPLSESPRQPVKTGDKKAAAPAPKDRFNGATLITLHEAIPARGVLALLASLPQE